MKIWRSILLFCAIAAVLIALLIWFGKKPNETVSSEPANTTNVAVPSRQTAVAEQKESTAAGTRGVQQANPARTNFPASVSQVNPDDPRRGLAALNDVPIIFDGKVEDQFGNPVVGARIDASVRIYNGFKSTVEQFLIASDANGFFHIDHGKGEALGIKPSKQGYVLATPNTYFKYSYMYPDCFAPDPRNPTVVKMWKLQGAEPLASIDQRYQFPYTGEPVSFDLLTGKIVSNGGDLKISVSRPLGIISQQHPQNWNIRMEIVDGGFIESTGKESAMTFVAPENGYQPSGTFGNNNGPDMVDKALFVQSRNGKVFSKFHLWFRINNKPDDLVSVTFKGVANTNASRNWEATASLN